MIAIPIVTAVWFVWLGIVGLAGSKLTNDGTPAKKSCTTTTIGGDVNKTKTTCVKMPYSLEDK